MRRNSTSSIGALHPVLFFIFIYGISLFLAIFVCRTVYYSVNDEIAVNEQHTKNTPFEANTAYDASHSTETATALK